MADSSVIVGSAHEVNLVFGSGVYFLFQGDELVYVGKSKDVSTVVARHRSRTVVYGVSTFKRFNRMFVKRCSQRRLDEVERACITHFRPKYNRTVGGKAIPAAKAAKIVQQFLGVKKVTKVGLQ